LKQAIAAVFIGAAWQRCRVHFMRNVLAKVPKASAEMVAAAIRTIFAQPDATHVRAQLDEVARMLDGQFPQVAAMLRDAAEDLLAFTGFPLAHWRKIWSTNPLERINGEIKRRTNVVGIFPTTHRSSASSPPCSSRPTTNGPSPNAATSPKNPWPRSANPPTPSRRRPSPSPPDTLTNDVDDHDDADLHHPAWTRVGTPSRRRASPTISATAAVPPVFDP
jgi:hypothetical protein